MKKTLDFKNGEILINTDNENVVRKNFSLKQETIEQVKDIANMLNCTESKAVEQSLKVVTKLIEEKNKKKSNENINLVKGKRYTSEEYAKLKKYFDEWDNETCKGYMILAMKKAGFNREDIEKTLESLRWVFDDVTLDGAKQEYIEW